MEPTPLSDREFERQLVVCLPGLKKYMGSFVRSELDDLIQDVALLAWKNRHRFDGANMAGWLVVIARNRFMSQARRAKRVFYFDPTEFASQNIPDVASNPHERLECKQTLSMMPKLSTEMQDALGDAMLGLTIEEVSEQRGLKLGTVKSRVHRARINMLAMDGDTECKRLLKQQKLERNARQNANYRKRREVKRAAAKALESASLESV